MDDKTQLIKINACLTISLKSSVNHCQVRGMFVTTCDTRTNCVTLFGRIENDLIIKECNQFNWMEELVAAQLLGDSTATSQ